LVGPKHQAQQTACTFSALWSKWHKRLIASDESHRPIFQKDDLVTLRPGLGGVITGAQALPSGHERDDRGIGRRI
jgi:hypothetical protein